MKNSCITGTFCAFITAIALALGIFMGYRLYTFFPQAHHVSKAIAIVHPLANNTVTGTVIFSEEKDGLHIVVECNNLTPGKHGFHIHSFGDPRSVESFCNHYNPTNKQHGCPASTERHVGDLGNIEADTSGHVRHEMVDSILALNGPTSIIGRSIIIHADEDDCVSQPSGNSGARIAYGVIGIAGK